jgi:fucose permease
MFLMFAMTTDAVGSIIPLVLDEYSPRLAAAGAFHYAPMISIAAGALLLGFLADQLGRKWTIVLGLVVYGLSSLLFAMGSGLGYFVTLLAVAGLGISIFKIGALALVGDISSSSREHTSLMNRIEGFFGVGAILGPAIVATLTTAGMSWKWLDVLAALVCALLVLIASFVRYPSMIATQEEPINLARTLRLARDFYALGFSALIAMYVAVEVAIYVWTPTYVDIRGAEALRPDAQGGGRTEHARG